MYQSQNGFEGALKLKYPYPALVDKEHMMRFTVHSVLRPQCHTDKGKGQDG
jgi:hypothetical protein